MSAPQAKRTDPMLGRTVLGRYRIVRSLAKGGMGVVYLARSEGASGFTKPVVVKRMASDLMVDNHMARMFVREARLMSRLRHPGLVQVIDFGQEDGDYLMVIEYVHGYHLGQWNRYTKRVSGPFPIDSLIHIMAKVLDALHYAHTLTDSNGRELGIVHRDVSPSNILIDVDGHVKLADFGVARSRDQTDKTEQSTIKGKMPYLAPELFRLEEPTANSDTYGCAVVIHELVLGSNEFRASDVATTVSRVLEHEPTPLSRARSDLPNGLSDVIQKALRKNPADRYQSAAELARALRIVRPLAEEEAAQVVQTRARADFTSDHIAQVIRYAPLAVREEALRAPPPVDDAARSRSSQPTTIDKEVVAARPERRSRWPWVWLAGIATVIIGGGIALAMLKVTPGESAEPDKPTFVVVQAAKGAGSANAEARSRDGGTTPRPSPPTLKKGPKRPSITRPKGRKRPAGSQTQSLTSAFQLRLGEVRSCAQRYGNPGLPRLVRVKFVVDSSGRVDSASLAPDAVVATPFGACLLQVAQSTRFPAQDRTVRFSIPVRVLSAAGGPR